MEFEDRTSGNFAVDELANNFRSLKRMKKFLSDLNSGNISKDLTSSQGKTECGGGWISFLATRSTRLCNCSIVPVGTGSICCFLSSAFLENFGKSFSATSSLIKTTPPSFKHWRDLCKLREVVPKSMTMSTSPLHASCVRSMSCFS